jgi:hypothetical protein
VCRLPGHCVLRTSAAVHAWNTRGSQKRPSRNVARDAIYAVRHRVTFDAGRYVSFPLRSSRLCRRIQQRVVSLQSRAIAALAVGQMHENLASRTRLPLVAFCRRPHVEDRLHPISSGEAEACRRVRQTCRSERIPLRSAGARPVNLTILRRAAPRTRPRAIVRNSIVVSAGLAITKDDWPTPTTDVWCRRDAARDSCCCCSCRLSCSSSSGPYHPQ